MAKHCRNLDQGLSKNVTNFNHGFDFQGVGVFCTEKIFKKGMVQIYYNVNSTNKITDTANLSRDVISFHLRKSHSVLAVLPT